MVIWLHSYWNWQIDNLEMLLLPTPNQSLRGGDSQNLSKKLSKKLKYTKEKNRLRRWSQSTKYFLQDNWQRVWIIALWIGVMCGLFAYKFVQYRNKAAYEVMGHCVCMAKGAAETLKLNMALILLPVCRNTITYLRNKTTLGVVIPFDDNLNFHQVIFQIFSFLCEMSVKDLWLGSRHQKLKPKLTLTASFSDDSSGNRNWNWNTCNLSFSLWFPSPYLCKEWQVQVDGTFLRGSTIKLLEFCKVNRRSDWDRNGSVDGNSLHASFPWVQEKWAQTSTQTPQESHWFQCFLVFPPPLHHCLHFADSTWYLPLPD